MGKRRDAYWILVTRPERTRSLARSRPRWEDNTKMDIYEVGWRDMDWIDLAQDAGTGQPVGNVVMNLQVPLNARNFLTS
jgi:hypothetical protein